MARQGANFAFHYNSPTTKDQTREFRDELLKAHPDIKISVHTGDLESVAAIEQLLSETRAEHDKIDLVVNAAGTVLQKPLTCMPEAESDKMLAYAVFVDEQRRRCINQYHAELLRYRYS